MGMARGGQLSAAQDYFGPYRKHGMRRMLQEKKGKEKCKERLGMKEKEGNKITWKGDEKKER